jgi:hypothetical protein
MSDKRAQTLIDRRQSLRAARATYDGHCQEIARLMLPGMADFTGPRVPGSKHGDDVFDGTAGQALDNLASGLWGAITNSANRWFEVRHADERLRKRHDVKVWCAQSTEAMMQALAADGQRFYAEAIGNFRNLAAFGTGPFFVEQPDPAKRKLAFAAKRLSSIDVAENAAGAIDTVYENFEWSARQAVQRWKNRVPKEIGDAAEKEPNRKFDFLFATMPAADWDGKLPRKDMRYAGVYVCRTTGETIEEGGFYANPWQVARWARSAGHPYGDSPAMLALPDVKMVNAMSKTTIVGAQKAVDPPILAPDEAGFRGSRMTAGQIVYGGVDPQGRALYQPFQTGGNIGLGLELEEQRRKAVRDAFYATLLLMAEKPGMTATEWLGRQEEKLRLWGPHIGLVQAEWLDPMLDTVFALMARASMPFWARGLDGWLPLPPDGMDPELKIEFASPLARAQKTADAAAVERYVAAISPVAQFRPTVLDNIDEDELARTLGEGLSLPERVLRDPNRVIELREARARQESLAQTAALAGPAKDGAAALESLARANSMSGVAMNGRGAPASMGPASMGPASMGAGA